MAMDLDSRIFVAGHRGLAGSAVLRRLQKEGFRHLFTAPSSILDLRRQKDVQIFFNETRPEFVFMCAATVGGAEDNLQRPGAYLYDNLMMQANVINAAQASGTQKLLLIGSSYLYPAQAQQPMVEDALLTGSFEPVKEFYSLSKVVGIKLCEAFKRQMDLNFFSVMPPNLYGPGDKYDTRSAHVIAALLRRFHEAKEKGTQEVVIWGSGSALREFLHVDDLADACVFLMKNFNPESFPDNLGMPWINCGSGEEISIRDLAQLIQKIVGYTGKIIFDPTRPEGAPRRLLDSSRLRRLGWQPTKDLRKGLEEVYQNFFLADYARSLEREARKSSAAS
ncbi:MAG: GDP-L-fucose synthase [Flavobacteriales bacterium]|nr:GDP-L-fucose synthase [Flavobacteriales bacterium]MDW8432865.1 GDP-L-fucose synthase [Flavobacteriales bacterium]